MVAFMSTTHVLVFLTGIVGFAVSLLAKDWTWFSRAGCLITVEAITFFAFFDEWFVNYYRRATGIDLTDRAGKEELQSRIYAYRAENPKDSSKSFEEALLNIGMSARTSEKLMAIFGALIWGFGDLPQKLY